MNYRLLYYIFVYYIHFIGGFLLFLLNKNNVYYIIIIIIPFMLISFQIAFYFININEKRYYAIGNRIFYRKAFYLLSILYFIAGLLNAVSLMVLGNDFNDIFLFVLLTLIINFFINYLLFREKYFIHEYRYNGYDLE